MVSLWVLFISWGSIPGVVFNGAEKVCVDGDFGFLGGCCGIWVFLFCVSEFVGVGHLLAKDWAGYSVLPFFVGGVFS